jgi:hypothetical protein
LRVARQKIRQHRHEMICRRPDLWFRSRPHLRRGLISTDLARFAGLYSRR